MQAHSQLAWDVPPYYAITFKAAALTSCNTGSPNYALRYTRTPYCDSFFEGYGGLEFNFCNALPVDVVQQLINNRKVL
jgi:hypothetical protein